MHVYFDIKTAVLRRISFGIVGSNSPVVTTGNCVDDAKTVDECGLQSSD